MGRKFTVGIILIVLAVAAYFFLQIWYDESDANDESSAVIVVIPPGSDFESIMDTLESADLLGDRLSFRMIAKVSGSDAQLKSGSYKFQRGISQAKLVDALKEGHSTVRSKVTFPEGVTIRRIASIVQEKIGVDSASFVRRANDRSFLESIGLQAESAEGYLMPDTYFFYWGTSPDIILTEMVNLFRKFYDPIRTSGKIANGLSPYETIILASLVEGEAKTEGDREIIARLYLNRLQKGMRLEADPTIQYVLPDGPRRLYYKDLEMDSPYNSYRNTGLPPTPINNPGRASIKASLNPPKNDYIFMVAKGDGSGAHAFSRTKTEHDKAVAAYRRRVNGK